MNERLYSAGIDVGTTTTQVIFSCIKIQNLSSSFGIPNVQITEKKIIHKSPVYMTPLDCDDKIDTLAVMKIIDSEFEKSGLKKEDVKTGAVIITGESARKSNAREAVQSLSTIAGDFVVAAAGPELESILAGYGSGAAAFSKEHSCSVLNLDIGGGTTNAGLFDCGKEKDAFALDIGGRLVRIAKNGLVTYVSPRISPLIASLDLGILVNEKVAFEDLKILARALAELLLSLCGLRPLGVQLEPLFIGHGCKGIRPDYIMFSGGVAECAYSNLKPKTVEETAIFGDFGPLLGSELMNTFQPVRNMLLQPTESIRATVIGAGNYSMKLSGSTVFFDSLALPIKNLPVVRVEYQTSVECNCIYENLHPRLEKYEGMPVAIAFAGLSSPSYSEVKQVARQIIRLFDSEPFPITVIIENDFAKALGQVIRNMLVDAKQIICIDGIKALDGDYVDIGMPVSQTVPVTVKTLAFHS